MATSASTPTIGIRQLAIGYRKKRSCYTVAEQLSAEIHSGELTCLLGPNGVGKSTLLRTLSAFQPPLSGEIELLGREISSIRESDLAQYLSVVLTERIDVGSMTARELVALGRSPYTGYWGRMGEADHQMVDTALERVGIEHLAPRGVHSLSDGERQKVMIAKAFAQDTPLIFLDEPTAFLDYSSKVDIMQLLLRLSREENKTIFLSTHDLDLALQIADKVWLMQKGGKVEIGIPEELALRGSIDRFLGGKGVYFDGIRGQFRIPHPIHRWVSLQGDPAREAFHLVSKALERTGIGVDAGSWPQEERMARISIETDREWWVQMTDQPPLQVSSIEEILNLLRPQL